MDDVIEVIREEFTTLVSPGAELVKIADGMTFTEGCCYVADGDFLVWSDLFADRMMRWSEADGVSVFRHPCGNANGNAVDLEGRLVTCETRNRRVSRTEPDGSVVTIADSYQGKMLTSPNDVTVKSDGSVWFSDPDYGYLHPEIGHGEAPATDFNGVYRLDPVSGEAEVVAEDFEEPNGIAFSPDESVLYIGDTGRTHGEDRNHHLRAFDVIDGRRLENGRIFAVVDPDVPDGFRCDEHGNVWVGAGDGVQVFSPDGELQGKIHTPETAANLSFGAPDLRTLFITATSSVWMTQLNTAGASRPA